ncbi:apoptotic protease-activating factor 1-like [Argiope bruennichi]|uniref:apoptotic protease-activating factor 1-like n=1 Tax=Argiope bruennichi TaxID=94029 RepID=UPI002494F492|nr:apoptotic protease-activating factor 1-like [Argiope bruennichi]XP_055934383.1 apoptotic protease-activating factor 1-like [Argiope bruennichi]XP_055934384.1 apoptotic protease-activating factor 1-like [Argiope bruennichi]
MELIHKLYSEAQAFKDDLRPKYIMNTLLKNKTITEIERIEIMAKVKPSDQVEVLFSKLCHKSPWKLKDFIKALEKDEDGCSPYPWLAKKLETACDINDKVYQILINGNVPFSISHLLPRDDKLIEIRDSLMLASHRRRHWVVLYGPIGSGKSVLAAEALRNNNLIEQCFPNGVYWLSIGSLKDDEAIKLKFKKLFKLMDMKYEIQQDDGAEDLKDLLKKEVGGRKILVILDDVFTAEVIKAFDIGCPILVTTKNLSALDKYSSFCSKIECKNNLKNEDILYILSKYVNCEINQLPEVVNDICVQCKGSPLVSSLIGSYMADIGNNRRKWEHLHDKLQERGTGTLRKRWKSGEKEDFGKIINLCLEPIQHLKDYYLDFLIFSKDVSVSNQVLEILWGKNDYEVLEIMSPLNKRCFVDMEISERVEKEDGDNVLVSYTSHDLYLDELTEQVGAVEIQNRHKKLIEKILNLCILSDGSYDWTKLPQSYIPFTIGYHLYHAGEHDMLKVLYTDLKFLEQIILLTEIWHVTSEYYRYENCFQNEEIEMFEYFLRRNADALSDTNNDIIQLALFEPSDSLVYKKAKDYAELNKGKYFDWRNKSESNYRLFNCKAKLSFKGMKHATFNHDASLVASVGEIFVEVWKTSVVEVSKALYGHSDVINYCSFNSKGDYLATASSDKTVRIFHIGESLTSSGDYSKKRISIPNFQQNKNIQMYGSPKEDNSKVIFTEHGDEVMCCSYSPDDHFIISSDSGGKTYVWEVGTEINEQDWTIKYVKHHKQPCFSCFSNDGKIFGTAIYDSIHLWDFETGNLKRILNHSNYPFKTIVFTPNDNHVLSVYDSVITKWNITNEKEKSVIDTCPDKSYVICSCCISPDGNFIACGTSAPSVIIIGAHSQNFVRYLQGHDDNVINVMFSKDNKKLLSVSSTQCIIHDISELTDTPQCVFEGNLSVQRQNKELDIIIASSVFFNTVEVREGLDGHLISKSKPEKENVTFCSLSSNCLEIVYGTKSGDVKIFNIASQSTVELLPKHCDQVNYILHSKNNCTFFTCSVDKTIKVWENNLNILTLTGHKYGVVMCVEFHKCNRLLSCSKDGSLRVWDTSKKSSARHLSVMEGHGNQDITFCDVSPGDVYLASSSVDGSVKVWKAENGDLFRSFRPKNDYTTPVRCCRFSPSGQFLIVGLDNGEVFFCHLLGNQGLNVLANRHDSVVHRIMMVSEKCVTIDGPLFLSLSKSIQLWNRRGQPLHTIILPNSFMGTISPCIWTSDNFDIIVVILNSILYILKRI